jgi:hypothetical protein
MMKKLTHLILGLGLKFNPTNQWTTTNDWPNYGYRRNKDQRLMGNGDKTNHFFAS